MRGRLAALLLVLALPAQAGDVVVTVEALRSDKGEVRLALFRESGWLDETKIVADAIGKAALPTVRIAIRNVPPGVYGLAAFHDENGNGRHDKNFLGLPLEGYGFSRDAPIVMAPPSFADARFEVPPDGAEIRFRMRY